MFLILIFNGTNYNKYKIVFSSDETNKIFFRYFKLKKFTLCKQHFISAGLYIGYNYYIQDLLQNFIESDEIDDQRFFSLLCENNNIGIDTNNIIFYNYQFFEIIGDYKDNRLHINKNTPCIISAPGDVNISNMCLVLFENGFRIFANQKRARIFKNGKTVFE
jgi:hypothetical protein